MRSIDLEGWFRFVSMPETHDASPPLVLADWRRMAVGIRPVLASRREPCVPRC